MLILKPLSSSSWWEIWILLQLFIVCFAAIRAGLLRQHLSPWRYDAWVSRVSVSASSSCFNISPSPDVTVKMERDVLKLQHVVGRNRLSIRRLHPPTASWRHMVESSWSDAAWTPTCRYSLFIVLLLRFPPCLHYWVLANSYSKQHLTVITDVMLLWSLCWWLAPTANARLQYLTADKWNSMSTYLLP